MEHSQIEFPSEFDRTKVKLGVPAVLVWLVSLAAFQPVGFAVILAIIGGMVWPGGGMVLGLLIGSTVAIWARGNYVGTVRPSETKQLRSGVRN